MKLVLEYTLKMGNGSNKHTTSANGQAQSLELIKYWLRHFVYHRRDSAFPYSFVLWQPNGPYCKCELCVNHPNISYIWPEDADMMTFAIFIRWNHTRHRVIWIHEETQWEITSYILEDGKNFNQLLNTATGN